MTKKHQIAQIIRDWLDLKDTKRWFKLLRHDKNHVLRKNKFVILKKIKKL
jgi:hypothetical protein